MFGFISDTLRTAVSVVAVPVAAVADVVTLGGTLTDRKESYTAQSLERVGDNVEKLTKVD